MLAGRVEVSVKADRDLVCLKIGSQEMRMDYADALKLSAWIRLRAKEAKRNAGDLSRRWNVIADVGNILDQ